MTAPDDMVRVSRRLVEKIVERHDGRYANVITYDDCEQLRAALSTPSASLDARRVERWEYRCMYEPLSSIVAEAGGQGWQLCAINSPYYWFKRPLLDAAAPAAPEDAKGEGVNELVAQIEAKYGHRLSVIRNFDGWIIYKRTDDNERVQLIPTMSDLLSALRAAASNTERE